MRRNAILCSGSRHSGCAFFGVEEIKHVFMHTLFNGTAWPKVYTVVVFVRVCVFFEAE